MPFQIILKKQLKIMKIIHLILVIFNNFISTESYKEINFYENLFNRCEEINIEGYISEEGTGEFQKNYLEILENNFSKNNKITLNISRENKKIFLENMKYKLNLINKNMDFFFKVKQKNFPYLSKSYGVISQNIIFDIFQKIKFKKYFNIQQIPFVKEDVKLFLFENFNVKIVFCTNISKKIIFMILFYDGYYIVIRDICVKPIK
ncbi:hypothetical protein AB836_01095 [Rickettsiales bacterium (ex Bugula neritina AB1)]|nr:hypothetical protein AB836_01095 [Rickettsiales bacterium (ex Bugula neritina AB1)]